MALTRVDIEMSGTAWFLCNHRNANVVMVTALVSTGDVEACIQRLQWIPGLSPWRPFHGWMDPHISWSPLVQTYPDSKVHGANMGPTWVLSVPDGPHIGPMNLAIRVLTSTVDVSTAYSPLRWVSSYQIWKKIGVKWHMQSFIFHSFLMFNWLDQITSVVQRDSDV